MRVKWSCRKDRRFEARLTAIPLFVNMVVAILVVNIRRVSGLDEFVDLSEPLYALCFLWLVFAGPGRISLDHLLWRRFAGPDTGIINRRRSAR